MTQHQPPSGARGPDGGSERLTFGDVARVLGTLADDLTPWLLDLGSWVFGGLIAVNLLILAALLTAGPVDTAVLVATTAFAVALPPDVGGFLLLRVIKDMQQVSLEEAAIKSFQDAGFGVEGEAPSPELLRSMRRRRALTALRSSYFMLALSVLATLTGISAALWHMAWWIAVAFMAMAAASLGAVAAAILTSPASAGNRPLPR